MAAAIGLPAAVGIPAVAATGSSGETYTATVLHFAAVVGPGGSEPCDLIGEMFKPAGASPSAPVPAILTTNGFGGSYTDQIGLARFLASRGYAVLTYSGLGFGGSTCKITLDDPDWDGLAARQLVSYLGGAPGIAYLDSAHTSPAPTVDYVIHDRVDHSGKSDAHDPRVGMIGGSYGGEIQFAAAGVDPRIDTIVPMITWNNLDYSLAPNNAGLQPLGGVTNPVPGVTKSSWAGGFSALGVADGLEYASIAPDRDLGCPNFALWVCPGLVTAGSTGYPDPATAGHLMHASVADYVDSVRIPTLLMQGENDTLFNLDEAAANYESLRARHVPVDMVWQSWGHSGSTPAPGELDLSNPDPATQYETARIVDWFDHYLKGLTVSTGPGFAYFRDWVRYSGIATPAYAAAASYPVGRPDRLYLSGGSSLVGSPRQITASDNRFVTPGAGAASSTSSPDAVGGSIPGGGIPDRNAPGTFVSWSSAPLAAPLDVAGIPVLHVALTVPTAPVTGAAGPAGDPVIFAKIYDVAPDGTASLIHGLVAPARIGDAGRPVSITLPGIVHRFDVGHRLELMLAGGDIDYRGGLEPTAITVATGSPGQVLDLPVVR